MRASTWLYAAIAAGAVFLVAALLTAAWLVTAPTAASARLPAGALDRPGDTARGKLVFAAGDCASCHASPGQPDRLHLGGGQALASPFGTFRAPNISPDPRDGIGAWQTEDLANALLSAVSPDGSHYYPAFPYTSFAHMSVGDVVDLMAYLKTLPPVSGKAPPHELNLLFRIRRFVGLWKLLYFDQSPIKPDVGHDDEWNRGRYLVESIGHCAECHSSRDLFGGIEDSTRFAGGVDPEGTGYDPNITPQHIAIWSKDQIVTMLRTGETPTGTRVGSSMSEVVTNTAILPERDQRAIATYIKALPARRTPHP